MEKDSRRGDRFIKSKKYLSRVKKNDSFKLEKPPSKKSIFRDIANSTLTDITNGYYNYMGNVISLIEGSTRYYSYLDKPVHVISKKLDTSMYIENLTTIQACKKMYFKRMITPCTLVFASAKKPGGGWLNGANAQEESIARCSSLYISLSYDTRMYRDNEESKNGFYTDSNTYCESVPIFKNEHGEYLPEVYYSHFVVCPVVNVSIIRREKEKIPSAMKDRIDRVLNTMYRENCTHIILGAYGCGVFGNNPEMVAEIFHDFLTDKYAGVFDTVVFAIPDENISEIFERVFRIEKD